MKLAFIFAHPDDESLSTGGTIAKYAAEGSQVITVCLSSDNIRRMEYLEAVKTLGIKKNLIFDYPDVHNNEQILTQKLIEFLLDFRPDIVITHIEEDYHIDHKSTYGIVREAIEWAAHETQHENAHLVSKLYTSETTILLPNPHIFVDISDFYQKKEDSIKCYKSQLYKGGDDFYVNFHHYRTLMRGTQASVKHAEAFMQIPLKKNSPFYRTKHSEL